MRCGTQQNLGDPRVVCQPADVFTNASARIDLKVSVAGDPPLYYEWFYQSNDFAAGIQLEDDEKIQGATSNVLHIIQSSTNDSGFYTCRILREDPKKGLLQTQTKPIFVSVFPNTKPYINTFPVPGFGVIRSGNPAPICNLVPTRCKAYATIISCSTTRTILWEPVAAGSPVTVALPANYSDAWIACKTSGGDPCSPCAAQGSLTFTIPPGVTEMFFTVYFPIKPAATGLTITYTNIKPICP